MVIRLEAWSFHPHGDGYTAPEERTYHLHGIVYGHPTRRDGVTVVTSHVVDVRGRRVRTESGSEYELGEPHPEYARWCEGIGKPIDPLQPIKMIYG